MGGGVLACRSRDDLALKPNSALIWIDLEAAPLADLALGALSSAPAALVALACSDRAPSFADSRAIVAPRVELDTMAPVLGAFAMATFSARRTTLFRTRCSERIVDQWSIEVAVGAGYPPPVRALTTIEEAERRLARVAVVRAGFNKSVAADMLGISRPKLYRLLDS